jgi:hypothetical protein
LAKVPFKGSVLDANSNGILKRSTATIICLAKTKITSGNMDAVGIFDKQVTPEMVAAAI